MIFGTRKGFLRRASFTQENRIPTGLGNAPSVLNAESRKTDDSKQSSDLITTDTAQRELLRHGYDLVRT